MEHFNQTFGLQKENICENGGKTGKVIGRTFYILHSNGLMDKWIRSLPSVPLCSSFNVKLPSKSDETPATVAAVASWFRQKLKKADLKSDNSAWSKG